MANRKWAVNYALNMDHLWCGGWWNNGMDSGRLEGGKTATLTIRKLQVSQYTRTYIRRSLPRVAKVPGNSPSNEPLKMPPSNPRLATTRPRAKINTIYTIYIYSNAHLLTLSGGSNPLWMCREQEQSDLCAPRVCFLSRNGWRLLYKNWATFLSNVDKRCLNEMRHFRAWSDMIITSRESHV
jgi:hypothetical protein